MVSSRSRSFVFLCCLLLSVGTSGSCGDSRHGDSGGEVDPGDLEGLENIEIIPAIANLVIDNDIAVSQEYQILGHFEDGSERDLTTMASLRLSEPGLGNFAGSTFTSGTREGGRATVSATVGDTAGTASLTLQLRKNDNDPEASDLPAQPGDLFVDAASDETRAPEMVYPNDGTLLPPNLQKLEVHFYPGENNSLFEVSFTSDLLDIRVYTSCHSPLGGGCIYKPTAEVWNFIAQTSRGEDPVMVQVRGTDLQGASVGTSQQTAVSFAKDNVEGGVYYWTTPKGGTDADSAILRWDFGATDQTEPTRVVSTDLTGGKCVGCHALSRDGSRMVVASDGSYNANVLLFDVENLTPAMPFDSTPPSAFSSYSADGTQFVGVFADESQSGFQSYGLNLFDGATGTFQSSIDVGGSETSPTTHPDWSPTGDAIVYTRIGQATNTQSGTLAYGRQASIAMVTRNGSTWSEPISLTAAQSGEGTYYPGFSPQGDLVVFNRSTCANGTDGASCDMYDDPTAALQVIAPQAGATPIALEAANAPGRTDISEVVENSFPRWAPFVFQRTEELGSEVLWLTFSSDRSYGLYRPEDGFTLIWMVAVDPARARLGQDPSFAAFALPFQDLTTDNHTAQWTERVLGVID